MLLIRMCMPPKIWIWPILFFKVEHFLIILSRPYARYFRQTKYFDLMASNKNNTLKYTIVKYLTLTLFFIQGQIKKKKWFCLNHNFNIFRLVLQWIHFCFCQKCHLWSYEWWTACEHPVCPDTSLITVPPENYLWSM